MESECLSPPPHRGCSFLSRTWGSSGGLDAEGQWASSVRDLCTGTAPPSGQGWKAAAPAEEIVQQKISSPSAGTSEAGPSPGWVRLPLLFFFFSFFSFGLDNPKSRVEVEVLDGAWLCPSGTFVWLAEPSIWKGPLSFCVREMLFLLGDTESSESNEPDLVTEGADGEENSSELGKKDGIRISLPCLFETWQRF